MVLLIFYANMEIGLEETIYCRITAFFLMNVYWRSKKFAKIILLYISLLDIDERERVRERERERGGERERVREDSWRYIHEW